MFYNVSESSSTEIPVDSEKLSLSLALFTSKDYVFLSEPFEEDGQEPQLKRKGSGTTTVIDGEVKVPITFNYTSETSKKPSSVQICGSFDKWQVRHPLAFDPIYNKWSVTLKIKKGTHHFKYIVDGNWVVSRTDKTLKDPNGYENNVITI